MNQYEYLLTLFQITSSKGDTMAPKSESEVAVTAPANDKKEKEKTGGKNLLIKQLTQTLLILN